MSQKSNSPLRRRMIEDMTVRNFVEKTRNDYLRHVKTFTAFLGRAPDMATAEELRRFQLHQRETGVHPPTINGSVAALPPSRHGDSAKRHGQQGGKITSFSLIGFRRRWQSVRRPAYDPGRWPFVRLAAVWPPWVTGGSDGIVRMRSVQRP
jgi:hypothetical protein